MSTILLPALRKPWHNLYRYTMGGWWESNNTTDFVYGPATTDAQIILSLAGLAVGDVVSASATLRTVTGTHAARLRLRARDASNATIQDFLGTSTTTTSFTRFTIENAVIPANTHNLVLVITQTAGGTVEIHSGMINRGATANAYETAKRGATAPWVTAAFARDNEQVQARRNSGVTQLTTFPSRRWLSQFRTALLAGDELREWALVVDQLSDLNNVFRLCHPRYTGPSTGYAGANPAVSGADQLGTSLDCDGVDASTAILKAGDYCSFEVTSPGSNTNVQLFKLAADATSDGSGNMTLTFTTPIRQAPADNAIVQIFSPTAQMAFVVPRAGIDLGTLKRAHIQVEAEERIWP